MEAITISQSKTQFKVRCPYCHRTHSHGNPFPNDKEERKEWRGSHCSKGEYFAVINKK